MTLGALIGRGRTADVYAWGEGQVLKLLHAGVPEREARYEADATRRVRALGLAAPETGDCLQVEGRWGIVFERVNGPVMMRATAKAPWRLATYARILAELQVTNHRRHCPELPSLREKLERKIRSAPFLEAGVKATLSDMLSELPDGDAVCHGDMHPDNVILSDHGPVLIDWLDARHGHPLADLARTMMLFRFGTMLNAGLALRLGSLCVRGLQRRIHLAHYRRALPAPPADLERWLVVVCAARLNEGIPGAEKQHLVAFIERFCSRQ